MSKKLLIKTWGCQMNEYDSSKMADLLNAANGYELTEIPEEADVLLLNTCSIREKAQEKVFHQLGRWKTLKDKKPGVVIGVGGCVATQEGDSIRDRAPYVDVIFGPQTLHRLPEMIKQSQTSDAPVMISLSLRLKNSTACLSHVRKAQRRSFLSWKAAQNTVLTA